MTTKEEHDSNTGAEPDPRAAWQRFLLPRITTRFLVRLGSVALVAFLFFRFVCIVGVARGKSMQPRYMEGDIVLCWTPSYWFHSPQRGDVVMVRLAGRKVMYLKRVVAVAGDSVEFRQGRLFLNGSLVSEPYVEGDCDWQLEPRDVPPGQVYVIGDNRGMPMAEHASGKVDLKRIMGKAL